MSTSPVCRCPRGTGELPSRLLAAKSAAASGHMPPATRPESPDTSTQRTKSVRSSRGIPVVMPLDPQQTSEDNAAPEEADHPPGTGRPESDDLRAAPCAATEPSSRPAESAPWWGRRCRRVSNDMSPAMRTMDSYAGGRPLFGYERAVASVSLSRHDSTHRPGPGLEPVTLDQLKRSFAGCGCGLIVSQAARLQRDSGLTLDLPREARNVSRRSGNQGDCRGNQGPPQLRRRPERRRAEKQSLSRSTCQLWGCCGDLGGQSPPMPCSIPCSAGSSPR